MGASVGDVKHCMMHLAIGMHLQRTCNNTATLGMHNRHLMLNGDLESNSSPSCNTMQADYARIINAMKQMHRELVRIKNAPTLLGRSAMGTHHDALCSVDRLYQHRVVYI